MTRIPSVPHDNITGWSIDADRLRKEGRWCSVRSQGGLKAVCIPAGARFNANPTFYRMAKAVFKDEFEAGKAWEWFSIVDWYTPEYLDDELTKNSDNPNYIHHGITIESNLDIYEDFNEDLSITRRVDFIFTDIEDGHTQESIGRRVEDHIEYNGRVTDYNRTAWDVDSKSGITTKIRRSRLNPGDKE